MSVRSCDVSSGQRSFVLGELLAAWWQRDSTCAFTSAIGLPDRFPLRNRLGCRKFGCPSGRGIPRSASRKTGVCRGRHRPVSRRSAPSRSRRTGPRPPARRDRPPDISRAHRRPHRRRVVPHGGRKRRRREIAVDAAAQIGPDGSALAVDAVALNAGKRFEQLRAARGIRRDGGAVERLANASNARMTGSERSSSREPQSGGYQVGAESFIQIEGFPVSVVRPFREPAELLADRQPER